MGRKRIDPKEKKVSVTLQVQQKYLEGQDLEELKEIAVKSIIKHYAPNKQK